MKKKQTITKLVATAAMAVASIAPSFAQTNLGSSCGCPSVASRPRINLSTLAVVGGPSDGDLLANTTLDCAHSWVLDKKIYVPNGLTLTVNPGTVIYGKLYSTRDSATALIVSRGGKIIANGTADCQIVMTGEHDLLDGSYPIKNQGSWGGLVIAGQANNTLTLDKNGPFDPLVGGKLCVADGLGTFDGFATSDFRDQYGVNLTTPVAGYKTTFDDNDNSGILKYVSVRYAGSILSIGGEINGISLGAVGRGTVIDHVEVISAADDNMEFFGGTVNVKNCVFMFGNDDGFDWDLGYSGKAQNVVVIKNSSNDTLGGLTGFGSGSGATDNGFEMDSDDQQSGNGSGKAIGSAPSDNGNGHLTGYRSHPVIYNCTFIGNNKRKENSDNTGMAAIMAKELTEGEIYSSVFANFAVGLDLWTGNKAGEGARSATVSSGGHAVTDSYDNWINGDLIIKNNTFVGMGAGANGASTAHFVKDVAKTQSYFQSPATYAVLPSDTVKFNTDGNTHPSSIPGFTYLWTMDNTSNAVTGTGYDATPNPALSTVSVAPADGFFTPENYRGAFASSGQNFLSNWSYGTLLKTTAGLVPCPTDVTGDGQTTNADLSQILINFGTACH